jgi:microcystin-dependent protein
LARDGTIGSATSGATIRANADCANLYAHLWNGLSNTDAPVTGGRGASAAADFAANKPIGGLDFRGVVRATFDSLGGNAANRLAVFTHIGQIGGEQTHQLGEAEMATHTHSVYDPSHTHQYPGTNLYFTNFGTTGDLGGSGDVGINAMQTVPTGVQINFEGGNVAHNNVQPTRVVTTIIKL